jgi:capsular polysaccharide transport system permease protein
MLPTLLAAIYYFGIAADRYVSETRFVIRTASKPSSASGGLNALMQLVGMSPSQDDSYAVRDFLTSRDALAQLQSRVDLGRIYGDPDADFLTHWPSLLYGRSNEDLYAYFQNRLSVIVNASTGLTTLRADAFRAEDARLVARTLLALGEDLVNRINVRMEQDALRVATDEVARAEQRRIAAQLALTSFRNRELMLDPGKSSAMVVELIGKLAGDLAATQAQIAEMRSNAPSSPQMASLVQRAAALDRQIGIERERVSNGSDGLASKIGDYERLSIEREFSIRTLSQAVSALDAARLEAQRQQLFLERVVEPGLPDEALAPRRWRTVLTVFGFNVLGFGVVWLLWAGLREHSGARH